MKHDNNKNHDNGGVTGRQLVPVHFEFAHPTALTVRIGAGDGYPVHWSKKSWPIRSGKELRS